jgi:hypothetical protein
LSSRLLSTAGVSGVGVPKGKLVIYLAKDTKAVRDKVAATLLAEAPGVPFDYVVTGKFEAQGKG